jgi:hypothetical protein
LFRLLQFKIITKVGLTHVLNFISFFFLSKVSSCILLIFRGFLIFVPPNPLFPFLLKPFGTFFLYISLIVVSSYFCPKWTVYKLIQRRNTAVSFSCLIWIGKYRCNVGMCECVCAPGNFVCSGLKNTQKKKIAVGNFSVYNVWYFDNRCFLIFFIKYIEMIYFFLILIY